MVNLAVEGEARVADAIAVAAYQRSEVRILGEVSIEAVEAEHHVSQRPFLVGHLERGYAAAISDDGRANAIGIGECVEVDRGPVGQFSKRIMFHRGTWCGRGSRCYAAGLGGACAERNGCQRADHLSSIAVHNFLLRSSVCCRRIGVSSYACP